ncbi:MAG: hypothetical protein SFU91_13755 [Chloroherpetonaceae bacterium]|nr:hypothetical protein [Chloroherpetonaceae bacterium]
MKRNASFILLSLIIVLFFSSCGEDGIDYPITPRTLQPTEENITVDEILTRGFEALFEPHGFYYSTNATMEIVADHIHTALSQNDWVYMKFGTQNGPRPHLRNNLDNLLPHFQFPFTKWHQCILASNRVLSRLDDKDTFQGSERQYQIYLAAAHFVKGMAYGYLANTFDKSLILSRDTIILRDIPFSTYREVIKHASAHFDTVISICKSSRFTLPNGYLPTVGGAYSSERLQRLAYTYKANFIVQNARSFQENVATNWRQILEYTENGLRNGEDFSIIIDGVKFDNSIQVISGLDWYWRVDHRILRYFDPNYPKRRSNRKGINPRQITNSIDERLHLYFQYDPWVPDLRDFDLWSYYNYYRYNALFDLPYPQNCVFLYAETNRLLKIEALAMTGQISESAQLLNDPQSRRKSLGKVSDVSPSISIDKLLDEILKERDLELMFTDYGLHFKDMRRLGKLQVGTFIHFPVPHLDLIARDLVSYTYGGQTYLNDIQTSGTQLDSSRSWIKPSEVLFYSRLQ